MLLKKQTAPRVGDNDPRVGASSIQKFSGEDLEYMERQKMQKNQIKVWTDLNIIEKQMAAARLEQEKEYYLTVLLNIDNMTSFKRQLPKRWMH